MTLTIDTKNKTIIIHGNVNVGDLLQAISGLENMDEYSIGTARLYDPVPLNPVTYPVWPAVDPYNPYQYTTKDPIFPPYVVTSNKTDNQSCK